MWGFLEPGRVVKERDVVEINQSNQRRRVLCIIPRPDNPTHPATLAAVDAGAEVETVDDPYRAMARMGPNAASPVDSVVVDVAALDASEMEFFDLAARYHWQIPVYVLRCGSGTVSSGKIDGALIRGARAAVSADQLTALLAALPTQADEEIVPARIAAIPIPESAIRNPQAYSAEAAASAAKAGSAIDPQETRRTPRKTSARVPWARYDDQPARKPPSGARSASVAPRAATKAEPPLLTQEELDALMDGRIAPPADPEPGEAS